MPRKRRIHFRINPRTPVSCEPALLSDPESWCWGLLADDGALLHEEVRKGMGPRCTDVVG